MDTKIRSLLNTRTGVKYMAVPDLIEYLSKTEDGQPPEVREFINNLIVTLATSTIQGTGETYKRCE
jgi:hypothetical protein